MGQYFPAIKLVHVVCVILSGLLFTTRGVLMAVRSAYANHVVLRRLSVAIDTTLLVAALALAGLSHQYPFVQGWLTAKVLLLAAYIVLGIVALRRGPTRAIRVGFFIAALSVYGAIVAVAVLHTRG